MDASTSAAVGALPSRSNRSCTDCTRRKTKCDRLVPCSACVKRGGAATCTAPERKKRGPEPTVELDARRTAALSEIEVFRAALDSLRARLPGLEHFIANVGGGSLDADELDEAIQHFGDASAHIAGGGGNGDSPSAYGELSRNNSGQHWRRGFSHGGAGAELKEEEDGKRGRGMNGEPLRKRRKDESVDGRSQGRGEDGPEGDEEAVEASVNLEFLALGRPRTFAESNDRTQAESIASETSAYDNHLNPILASASTLPSPVSVYPDGASLFNVSPSRLEEKVIFHQGLELLGWHHSVVHAPTFNAQVDASWELGDKRFDACSSAWLALYFALLAVSTKLLGQSEQSMLGWSEQHTAAKAGQWFECAIACLYRHNFLQQHDFHSLQAIALLALSGRDAGSATLIASLLATGISIAQDLGLHRLPSDKAWASSLTKVTSKALIDRELRKRVMYALAHTDWFSLPFRDSVPLLHKSEITTPLPLNITDADLAQGRQVNRPSHEYTPVGWLLQYIEIGHCMELAYNSVSSARGKADYDAFLEADERLDAHLKHLPPWLREGGPTTGMPPCVEYMRTTFSIAASHKVLSMHRPFLFKPFSPSAHNFSRKRVLATARSILREARNVRGVRIWTVLYHISAASFIVMLELFEAIKRPSQASKEEAERMREEVVGALQPLIELRQASGIADRGVALVQPLLAEERRLREEQTARMAQHAQQQQARTRTTSAPLAQTPVDGGTYSNAPTPRSLDLAHAAQPTPTAFSPIPFLDNFAVSPTGEKYPAPFTPPENLPSWFFDMQMDGWLDSQLSGLGAGGTGVGQQADVAEAGAYGAFAAVEASASVAGAGAGAAQGTAQHWQQGFPTQNVGQGWHA